MPGSARFDETSYPEPIQVERSEMSGWIVVAGDAGLLERLCAAGVPAIETQIEDPELLLRGVAFPDSYLPGVRAIIPVLDTFVRTNVEGVRLGRVGAEILASAAPTAEMPVPPAPTTTPLVEPLVTYQVVVESMDNMEYISELHPVLQSWADRLKLNISIRNVHNVEENWDGMQPDAGWLRVLFWANASGLSGVGSPVFYNKPVYGVFLASCQSDNVMPSKLADYEIISPEGTVVAEVSGRTLFVLFDLPHGPCAKIMDGIMSQYRTAAVMAADSTVEISKRLQRLVQGLLTVRVSEAKAAILSRTAEINNYANALQTASAALASARQVVAKLEQTDTAGLAKLQREYQKLLRTDKVAKVTVLNDTITVTTEPMNFSYQKLEYKGNAYKIELTPAAGAVYIKGVPPLGCTISDNKYAHPHVNYRDNKPCFGNLSKGIYRFLAELEFAALVQVIIQYLQVANDSDWYLNPAECWRRASVEPAASTATVIAVEPAETEQSSMCAMCQQPEDECECWTCEGCDRMQPAGDWCCSVCSMCESCCDCWTCARCSRMFSRSSNEIQCSNCDCCRECCTCSACAGCGEYFASGDICADCSRCESCGCNCEPEEGEAEE